MEVMIITRRAGLNWGSMARQRRAGHSKVKPIIFLLLKLTPDNAHVSPLHFFSYTSRRTAGAVSVVPARDTLP
jgi:hypothetical protein